MLGSLEVGPLSSLQDERTGRRGTTSQAREHHCQGPGEARCIQGLPGRPVPLGLGEQREPGEWGARGEHEPSLQNPVFHNRLLVSILGPNICGRGPEAFWHLDGSECYLQSDLVRHSSGVWGQFGVGRLPDVKQAQLAAERVESRSSPSGRGW